MGKLIKKTIGGASRAGGNAGTSKADRPSKYSGNIMDSNMTAITGKKYRKQRDSASMVELLGA